MRLTVEQERALRESLRAMEVALNLVNERLVTIRGVVKSLQDVLELAQKENTRVAS